jgi:hypothetical protein
MFYDDFNSLALPVSIAILILGAINLAFLIMSFIALGVAIRVGNRYLKLNPMRSSSNISRVPTPSGRRVAE